jgi:hypothetical protein
VGLSGILQGILPKKTPIFRIIFQKNSQVKALEGEDVYDDGCEDEEADVAGFMLSNTLFPKRCEQGDGKPELVDGEERLPFTVQMLGSRDSVSG